jgi:hypothetical protein
MNSAALHLGQSVRLRSQPARVRTVTGIGVAWGLAPGRNGPGFTLDGHRPGDWYTVADLLGADECAALDALQAAGLA